MSSQLERKIQIYKPVGEEGILDSQPCSVVANDLQLRPDHDTICVSALTVRSAYGATGVAGTWMALSRSLHYLELQFLCL